MLERVPVPQAAAKQIQAMILEGRLKAGEKIPSQRDLALELKLSRASLREALLALEAVGLITTQPGRGTFVTETSTQDRTMSPWRYTESYSVAEVFQTRAMLESQIARLAAAVILPERLDDLGDATTAMAECWARGDLLGNVDADLNFHRIIVEACPNRMLVDLYTSTREKITATQIRPIPVTQPRRMTGSIAEHRAIIAALRQGHGETAATAMRDHIRNTAKSAGVSI